MTAGVYRITHAPTGRIYIGSSNDIERRLHTHLGGHGGCPKLARAVRRHGRGQFRVDVLDDTLDVNELPVIWQRLLLSACEQFYLEVHQPWGASGFNVSKEADAPRESNKRPHPPCLKLAISAGLLGKKKRPYKSPGKSAQMRGNKLRQGKPWSAVDRARISAQTREANKRRPRGARGRWTEAISSNGAGTQLHNGL